MASKASFMLSGYHQICSTLTLMCLMEVNSLIWQCARNSSQTQGHRTLKDLTLCPQCNRLNLQKDTCFLYWLSLQTWLFHGCMVISYHTLPGAAAYVAQPPQHRPAFSPDGWPALSTDGARALHQSMANWGRNGPAASKGLPAPRHPLIRGLWRKLLDGEFQACLALYQGCAHPYL